MTNTTETTEPKLPKLLTLDGPIPKANLTQEQAKAFLNQKRTAQEIAKSEEKQIETTRKMEIAEIVGAHSTNEIEAMCFALKAWASKHSDTENSDAQELFKSIQDGDAFLTKDIPEPPEIIKGLFRSKQIMMLSASSKVGKTWLATRLGLCVSEGQPWLGMKTVKTKTLFINTELSQYDMHKRLGILHNQEMPGIKPNNFNVLNLSESKIKGARLLAALPELCKMIKEAGYGLVIIDPIYQLYGEGTDENSAGDVKNVLDIVKALTLDADVAVVFTHHFSKGSQARKDAMDCFSGSGVFFRYVNCSMAIVALEDNDANESYAVHTKQGSFPFVKPFGIKIKGASITLDNTLNLKAVKDPGKYRSQFSKDNILNLIISEPIPKKELKIKAKNECGMSNSTFDRLWRDVETTPGVTKTQDDRWVYDAPGTLTTNTLEGNKTLFSTSVSQNPTQHRK